MLIECPHCRARVDAKVEGKATQGGSEDDPLGIQVSVGKCPSCSNLLVGLQQEHPECGWYDAERVWPQPKKGSSWTVPDIVRSSLEEADRCYSSGAFTACVVMCGRALEGMCVHHKTKSKTLNQGLKELLDNGIIDKRLFTWGDELRKIRNLGAHATGEKVPKQDAFDVVTFAHAITEYVFVLHEQFEEFMARRVKPKKA